MAKTNTTTWRTMVASWLFTIQPPFVIQDSDGNSAGREMGEDGMKTRYILTTACAASIFALALVQHTQAMMSPSKTMEITFNQPVRLPGVGLGAGTYIFEVADPTTSANVVRVLSHDRKSAYFQGFT